MKKSLLTILTIICCVKVFAQQGFTAGADKVITCLQSCVTLDAKVPSNDWVYYWSSNKGFFSQNLNPKVCESGIYYLHAQLDQTIFLDTVVVSDFKFLPKADAGKDKTIDCLFPEVVLDIQKPEAGFGVFVTGPDNFISNDLPIKTSKTGTYIVKVFKGSFCESFDTVEVKLNKNINKPDAGADFFINCNNPTAKLNPVFPGKEVAYEWYFQDKKISDKLQPIVNQIGKYVFKISQGECNSSDTIEVKGDFRKAELSGEYNYTLPCITPGCITTEVNAKYADQASFYWYDVKKSLYTTSLKTQICEPGIFTLKSKLAATGCIDEIKIKVAKPDSIKFLGKITPSCNNAPSGSIVLENIKNATPPLLFSINGINYQKAAHFENLKVGDYKVLAVDSKGCKGAIQVQVPVRTKFEWNIPNEYSFCSHDQPLELDVTVKDSNAGKVSYVWSDGTTSPNKKFLKSETVWVEAHGECFDAKNEIKIKDNFDLIRDSKIYAPTIFNPNSKNEENQGYKSYTTYPFIDYQLRIFDRAGDLIFETNNPKEIWDGTYHGKTLISNTFIWHIRASIDACGDAIPFQDTGTVFLMHE